MSQRAPYACISCKKAKRKCTKELPKCSLCRRLQKSCDYTDDREVSTQDELTTLQSRVKQLERKLQSTSQIGDSYLSDVSDFNTCPTPIGNGVQTKHQQFPLVFFLEPEITWLSRPAIPRPVMTVPEEVISILGGWDQYNEVTSTYFKTIHQWLPFIAKKRIELTLSNPSFELKPEMAALLLAMNLTVSIIRDDVPMSHLYQLTKNYFTLLESSSYISVQLIQTGILISVYEIGHAIYPAAYLSPGRAVRLGQAYGIDNRQKAPQMGPEKHGSWVEDQEVKRTWWATMILDRFVNLGINGHALATGDPSRNQMLPADCHRWDNGEISTTQPLYVFSSLDIQASPFARTCQAANLMGRYIRHRDDDSDEASHSHGEALQLHRTISAFSKLLPNEILMNTLGYATSAALSYSTLLHLYDPYSCSEFNNGTVTAESVELQTIAIAGLRHTALDVLALAKVLSAFWLTDLDAASPFIVECLFQAASTFAWIVHENGPGEMLHAYNHLKGQLDILGRRWTLAKVYLDILEQAKSILYKDNVLL